MAKSVHDGVIVNSRRERGNSFSYNSLGDFSRRGVTDVKKSPDHNSEFRIPNSALNAYLK